MRYLIIILLLMTISCEENETQQEPNAVNSFKFILNMQEWEPAKLGDGVCEQAFNCEWYSLSRSGKTNEIYRIKAYHDPENTIGFSSENILEIQISQVEQVGNYSINGSYKEEFSSYILFIDNKTAESKTYINKLENPFIVQIDEFLPIDGSSLTGFKGSFRGTIYNEIDPKDSINISDGAFLFEKINWYDFNQCWN